jgi:hypothetical protein
MSESPLPKNWNEAASQLLWGVFAFASGFEGVVMLFEGHLLLAALGILGAIGLTGIAIRWHQIAAAWPTFGMNFSSIASNAKWWTATILILLLVAGAYPLIEKHGWPRVVSSAPSADEIAAAVVRALPKSEPSLSVNSSNQTLCFDGPCAPSHKKPGPEYLKQIGLGIGSPEPLSLQAISAVTTDRLRVFIDYSEYRSGWMPRARAFIGEFKEPVKGSSERLQLIYSAKKDNAGENTLWWGEPSQNNAVTTPTYSSTIPAFIVRARVVVIAPSGEQHYYFMLVRGADNVGTYVGVIPEYDSGDWISQWEQD